MRDIELIQAHREPDYPEFSYRATGTSITYLRSKLNGGGYERLIAVLSPPW